MTGQSASSSFKKKEVEYVLIQIGIGVPEVVAGSADLYWAFDELLSLGELGGFDDAAEEFVGRLLEEGVPLEVAHQQLLADRLAGAEGIE